MLLRLEYLKSFCNSAALAVNDFTYTYRELLVAGYSICMVQSDDLNGYLVYRMDEKKRLLIRETNLSKECYEEIMSSFIDKMGAASLCIKTAEPWFDQADKISYSMIKCLDTCNESKQYYMNLMLDD